MNDLQIARECLSIERFPEKVHRIAGFRPAIDTAIDAEFLVGVRLRNLPRPRSANNDSKTISMRVRLDLLEKPQGIKRVDGVLGTSKHRRIHTRRKSDAKGIVRGHGYRARCRTDKFIQGFRMRDDAGTFSKLPGQNFLQHTKPGRRRS